MRKNHSVIIEDEEYSSLSKETANKMISRIKRNYEIDGYKVKVTTYYDRMYREYIHIIDAEMGK